LESPHKDDSNGSITASLAFIDNEIDLQKRTHYISWSSDGRIIKYSLLESSHQDGSNGGKIEFLASLDGELVYQKKHICMFKYFAI
jgi:hypothetical protein